MEDRHGQFVTFLCQSAIGIDSRDPASSFYCIASAKPAAKFNLQIMKHSIPKIAVLLLSSLAVVTGLRAGPSANDVGDAETFGHSALYMGATSGFVTLAQVGDCPAATPTPSPVPLGDSFCDELNAAPAQTNFSHDNICRINLPKKASRNVIYPVLNIFLSYQLQNSTAADQTGLLRFTAGITIVSDALNGPDCIDQNTSAPCGGKLTLLFNYSFRDDRNMHAGDRQRLRETLV